MPYLSEKIRIDGTEYDRRKKLDDHQRACLKAERERDGTSYQKLANKYGVSKRLAMFVCNPEMAAKAKEQYLERRKDGRYYDKEKATKTTDEHRKYKQDLHLKGLI